MSKFSHDTDDDDAADDGYDNTSTFSSKTAELITKKTSTLQSGIKLG